MSFAREGLIFIVIAALIAAGTYAVALNRRSWPLWLLAFLFTVIALWVAYFFRDPKRTGARGEQVVIAPADGKVRLISDVDEPAFIGGKVKRLSIIRFGSRVDAVIRVKVGDLTVAGTSVVAELPKR